MKATEKQKKFVISPSRKDLVVNRQRIAAVVQQVTAVAGPTSRRRCSCGGMAVIESGVGLICMFCHWAALRMPRPWQRKG